MDWSSLYGLLGAFGVGSLFATILKAWSDNRRMLTQRIFEEKRDAYINYLNIVATSQTMPEKEALWARTAAIERIHLCGSPEVLRRLAIVTATPPNSPRKPVDELVQAMRADLFS
ncbi:hypothetical protein [Desulfovibrio aminophilus]|uniref:hypothetical protein n=1 Tax=Desulfovibrio aminophilus TaxID=81425 RepID=UPI0033928492